MEGYNAKVRYTSKELSPKEKIAIKDTASAESLDELTENAAENVVIDYSYHVIIDVHNEHSDNKDYVKTVVVDKNGTKYVTGSQSFTTQLEDIVNEMTEAGCADDITIEVYRKESKNYKGKSFITCKLV